MRAYAREIAADAILVAGGGSVMAVATDPIGMFYPIPPEKIAEISLKAIV